MSYSEETLLKKFDGLEETQDSIVSTSQWVLFYYRYADKIAVQWEKYIATCPKHKKLALVYLVNDVVQQSRSRKKTEFIEAFGQVFSNALTKAYAEVPPATQKKFEKIIRVLNDRNIFATPLKIAGVSVSVELSGGALKGTDEEKIQALATTGSKFQRFYHELLLGANGAFTETHLPKLHAIDSALTENITLLQELQASVSRDIEKVEARTKVQREKTAELIKKQQELEEQRKTEDDKRRIEEEKRLEELKRQEEEDKLLPTYQADSDDDSDEDRKKDSDEDSDDDVYHDSDDGKTGDEIEQTPAKQEASTDQESKDNSNGEPRPKKRLRFAE